MKRIISTAISLLAAMFLFGCATAGAQTTPDAMAGADSALQSQGILKFTLGDLEAAAKYADTNGYPARAAVYRSHAAHLTAVKAQVEACKAAIKAALPKPLDTSGGAGAFLLFEMAAEKVGQGIPAADKVNCGVITLP